jgi:hypothetical protein
LSEQSAFQFLNEYFKPIDRLFSKEVKGKEPFCETTGLGLKWLTRMEPYNDSLKKSDYKQP